MNSNNLSDYEVSILNSLLPGIRYGRGFNLLDHVIHASSGPLIFATLTDLALATYINIKSYLLENGFVVENEKEKCFSLTTKGAKLARRGSLQKYIATQQEKAGSSVFKKIIHRLVTPKAVSTAFSLKINPAS